MKTTAFVIALTCLAASSVRAGDWHNGAHAQCSDCHTQHNSANGLPMRTDNNPTPAAKLLLRETPLQLCLSCHDGANANAPDVVAPVSYVTLPAGGWFANAGGFPVDPGASFGHHLNTPSPVVPPGGTQPMILTCTTCHDPHGNGNYRNLRSDPSGGGAPAAMTAVQSVVANGSNPAQVYAPSNVIYKSNVSRWCGTCHGTPQPGSDHPTDVAIFGSMWGSYPTWAAVTLPRASVLSPNDNTVPSTDDRVICLSCHKAHGTANPGGTFYADEVSIDSTCLECHDV